MGSALKPRGTRAFVLCVCISVTVGMWAPANAVEVTSVEARELARRAATDPAALRGLREVTSIEGRPVSFDRALAGAEGEELTTRLRAFAADPAPTAVDADTARARASEILSEGRFQDETTLPRPFRGLLDRIGDWLERVADPIARVLPGGDAVFWTVVAGAVVAVAVFVAAVVARRRVAVAVRTRAEARRDALEDPRALEREADAAEQSGDIERAVRLRFRAGLLRLDTLGAISYRPSITTGEVHRRLRLRSFATLARRFDEIAYGGREADPADAQTARDGWPKVLEEVGSTWQART